jgi:nucleoside-diphosphate-sugar epimerase
MVHIAITGASGLIGSHATQYALSQGHTVTAIDIAPLPEHLKLPEGSIFCQVDCTDFRAVEDALKQIPCDGVIHLSAIANPKVS